MKKLILLLFIPLVFGCSEDSDEPFEIIENQINEIEGLWSGLIEGDNSGTWTFSVYEDGNIEGSITSYEFDEMYSISGSVTEDGFLQSDVTLIETPPISDAGTFVGNLSFGQFSGSFDNLIHSKNSDTFGRSSTDEESTIINKWYFYSGEYSNGDIYYYDNSRYCPNLYMEFNSDGTFIDYFVADYSENPEPICAEEDAFFGTFSVQDGYYQFTYEAGGIQDLSGSDIYISYPDSNTMEYTFDSVIWTYKLDISQ